MKANELRKKYLEFFKSKGHEIIPSSPVVPENDPTVLFTTAGMHPLVPYLMGEKHPKGKRLTNSQKCIRTVDIDEVGDTTHHTFFEMLGNWSLGDYFKKEAIEWSWEFLTDKKWLGLDPKRLAVSVFEGDKDAPLDEEAIEIWRGLGVSDKRIARLPKNANWWGPAGKTGPCGPDSEMFYWVGDLDEVPESFNDDHDNWVEIWNDVFMQYNKTLDGKFEKLEKPCVDTGMGLVRVLAAMNGLDDNYRTEIFWPIIEKVQKLSGKKYDDSEEVKRSMRIIADHIKAALFMIGDGVIPSNVDRGYIVRRLIRRAVRQGKVLGIEENFTIEVAKMVQGIYEEAYCEILSDKVLNILKTEEEKFRKTLEKGLKELSKLTLNQDDLLNEIDELGNVLKGSNWLDGKKLFYIFSTFGFPFEMSVEELNRNRNSLNLIKDESNDQYIQAIKEDKISELKKEFDIEFQKHQEKSRTASAGMFKGGLADTREDTMKLHTVAHLMLAGLRKVLGEHVHQKGSNINGERLRFDFSHGEKMTDEEKKAVEDFVNKSIEKKIPVIMTEMPLEEAKKSGAEGAFENKYGNVVKVYEIKGFSKEICGGPHVENTGDIDSVFKIKKEKSSSAGVRRIKAVIIKK